LVFWFLHGHSNKTGNTGEVFFIIFGAKVLIR
jgi:hypothetical protein